MPEATEQAAPPLRTWRPMVLWSAGILLALGLACWITWWWAHSGARKNANGKLARIAWTEILRAWKAYELRPCNKTGEELLAVLPDQPGDLSDDVHPEAARTISHIDQHWEPLRGNIRKADPVAVQIGFKLTLLLDNAAAPLETLHDVLGQVIPRNPALFLAELKKHGVDRIDVGSLTCCCFDLVDDLPAQERELKRRLAALQTVNDPGVRLERDLCLQAIEDDLRKYHGPGGPSQAAAEALKKIRGEEAKP